MIALLRFFSETYRHGDAYCGIYSLIALQCMVDIKAYLGKADESIALDRWYNTSRQAYVDAYWSETDNRFDLISGSTHKQHSDPIFQA